jgi:hypothetical protein
MIEITLVRVEITLCVLKSHSACGNHTLRAEITLVRVEITLVRVEITLVRIEITLVHVETTLGVCSEKLSLS